MSEGEKTAPIGATLDLAELFREHAAYVWRVLRQIGVAEADVDDLCQEVFLVAHRKLAEFEGRSSIRTWLYSIALRTASDQRRRAHVRREQPTDKLPEDVCEPEQQRRVERIEARELLRAALDGISEDKRTVFVLYEVEQLPMPEVAEIVGCPLFTAYSRLRAARKQVREALGDTMLIQSEAAGQ